MRKLFLIIFAFIILINIIENRKKKKKPQQPKKEIDPIEKRPSNIKPELYCDSCIAMVQETIKELRGKKKESDVLDIIENVCDPERYYTYHHPPPDMREGCETFLAIWEDELVNTMIQRTDSDSAVQMLCYNLTKACSGVDPSNVKQFDDTIMVDGQPQKIGEQSVQKEEI